MARILKHRLVQYTLSTLIIGATLLCVFTPDVFLFKQGATFTVQIMFVFLLSGMLFLVLREERLMFLSLGACGILALFLQSHSDQSLRFPILNTNPSLSVAHIDLSLSDDYATTMHSIWSADVDVVSFQEYTPYWEQYLPEELASRYPYQVNMTRIDPYGMAIYSKFPIEQFDTLVFAEFPEIPCIHAIVNVDGDTRVNLISSHTLPPVNDLAYDEINGHFSAIGAFVTSLEEPTITLGDYSLPSWSEEIKEFKRTAQLSDSRRDIVERTPGSQIFLFNIPIDHIFYTSDIECTAFGVITDEKSTHLGITGHYQLKTLASLKGD